MKNLRTYLSQPVSIAPLVVFRIAFGLLMCVSITRFMLMGWVDTMYVMPKLHFPYYGFEWVKAFPAEGMYAVFALLLVSSLFILAGFFYRLSASVFFILFTYVELIDKTNYLNHYYFISLVSFLLIFLPAANAFSVDNLLFRRPGLKQVPRIAILPLQLQMFVVYFFAGVAKLNGEWLLNAMPLKIWLPAYSHYPLIGPLLEKEWVAYAFSWFGCGYDLVIGFFLFSRRWVYHAYFFVVLFHAATAMFFNIGMFPYIMMTITIVFFREDFHEAVLRIIKRITRYREAAFPGLSPVPVRRLVVSAFVVYFFIQFFVPLRHMLYPGKLFWTEEGYRFSWRVMLMEKAGAAFFSVTDKASGRSSEVDNREYLTYMQEKMMATQPDMMVDYAKFLKAEYAAKGYKDPEVRAQSFVTVNGCGTREYIDPTVDLASMSNSFMEHRRWVRCY